MTLLVLLVLRLVLAGVLALAGLTKFLDRRGTRQSLTDFGVPEWLIPAASVGLPVAELATALALLPEATAVYGAIGAAVLLATFTVAVALNLVRGRRPDCHCFGQLHSEPVGWRVLVRNGVLLGAAVFVIVTGWPGAGPGAGDWLLSLSPAWRAVVVAGVLGLSAYTVRMVIRARTLKYAPVVADWSASAIAVGEPAPDVSLTDLDGGTVTLSMLRAPGHPVVLIFTDPHCSSCTGLLPDVAQWQRDLSDRLTVVLVSRDTPAANRAKIGSLNIDRVLLQRDREVGKTFGVSFTPGVIVVRADGTMGGLPAPGEAAVRRVVAELSNSRPPAPAVVGGPAPDFSLPDLQEREVTLGQLRGRATVLLFWDPGCTFCEQLLGQIRFWEARPLTDRPTLLVVAKGDVSTNALQGFRSTTVLDQRFAVGRQYGVKGTPSAALIDAEGRLASELAVGGAAILELIGQPDLGSLSAVTSQADNSMDFEDAPQPALAADARPVQRDCVQDEMLEDGSLVLYNGCRKQVMTLNPTAALVWAYCDGEHDIDAIVDEVAGVFPTAPRPDADVRAMLESFLQSGLIADGPARLS